MEDDSRIVDLGTKSKNHRRKPANGKRTSQSPEGRRTRPTLLRIAKRRRDEKWKENGLPLSPPSQKRKLPPPPKKRCWLLQLPVELVEMIFFASLETNMALASPLLGRILSSETVFRVLIRFAFFDPRFDILRDRESDIIPPKLFHPAVFRELGEKDRVNLQRNIMSKRWLTMKRLEDQLLDLAWLVACHRRYLDQPTGNHSCSGHDPQDESEKIDSVNQQTVRRPDIAMILATCNGAQKLRAGLGCLSVLYLGERHLSPQTWNTTMAAKGRTDDDEAFHSELVLPRYYRTPPSKALLMLRLLTTAVTAGRSMATVVTRQHLFGGIKTALLESNKDAFELLILDVALRFLQSEMDHTKSKGWRDLLRFVSKNDHTLNNWYMTMLLSCLPPRYIDRDDPVLIKWAVGGRGPHEVVRILREDRPPEGRLVKSWFLIEAGLEQGDPYIRLDSGVSL